MHVISYIDKHSIVRPMQTLGHHNEHNDAHYATKQKSYVIVRFKNCGKYRCEGMDLPITIDYKLG